VSVSLGRLVLIAGLLLAADACSKSSKKSDEDYLAELRRSKGMAVPTRKKGGPEPTSAPKRAAATPEELRAAVKKHLPDLGDENDMKRLVARTEVQNAGKVAVPDLVRYIRDSSSAAGRETALDILAEVADESVVSDVEALLKDIGADLTPPSRSLLVKTLDRYGDGKYAAFFRQQFARETDHDARMILAVALARTGDPSGTGIFMETLVSGTLPQKQWAATWLKGIYKQDFGTDAKKWQEWIDKQRQAPPGGDAAKP
jgi:HEAT repeat protein